jgi:hypothetical protein
MVVAEERKIEGKFFQFLDNDSYVAWRSSPRPHDARVPARAKWGRGLETSKSKRRTCPGAEALQPAERGRTACFTCSFESANHASSIFKEANTKVRGVIVDSPNPGGNNTTKMNDVVQVPLPSCA